MESRLLIRDVIAAIEEAFPPRYQEDFDNTGLQIGPVIHPCTGALICVDITPEIVIEAVEKGCNLIITHHPLIFKPLKQIVNFNRVDISIYKAIQNGITVYSCHTSADNTPRRGVSWKMGEMLGLSDIKSLESHGPEGIGCGIVGRLKKPLSQTDFVELVKSTFGSPIARCSKLLPNFGDIDCVGLCGGAGGFLIDKAIAAGARAFITSDCKYNQFLDYVGQIFLVDIGHFESEECTKSIFYQTITEKFPNFALYKSELEKNPIIYL